MPGADTIAAYGAAAKGNTLLNYAGIGPDLISYCVDRNPAKQNTLLPGSHIPIHGVEGAARNAAGLRVDPALEHPGRGHGSTVRPEGAWHPIRDRRAGGQDQQMARVLLTGATGLIGRATVPALTKAGHEVVTLGRNPASDITCDLLDPNAITAALETIRASHLVHLAWHDGPRDRWTSAANLDWMAATLHLVREFARTGGQRAVCAGSCAEFDWSVSDLTEANAFAATHLVWRGQGRNRSGTVCRTGFAWPFTGLGPYLFCLRIE